MKKLFYLISLALVFSLISCEEERARRAEKVKEREKTVDSVYTQNDASEPIQVLYKKSISWDGKIIVFSYDGCEYISLESYGHGGNSITPPVHSASCLNPIHTVIKTQNE